MSKAYKNVWNLNVDEAVVTGILRDETAKGVEIFASMNAQMKDIDLVVMNMTNKRVVTIQVKGSRAYEPKKSEVEQYGDGSAGWFWFSRDVIDKSTADWFIFLVYVLEQLPKSGRRVIVPHTITISTKKLKHLTHIYKRHRPGTRDNFTFWINPKTKKAFDMKDDFDVSEYLDKNGFKIFNEVLR